MLGQGLSVDRVDSCDWRFLFAIMTKELKF